MSQPLRFVIETFGNYLPLTLIPSRDREGADTRKTAPFRSPALVAFRVTGRSTTLTATLHRISQNPFPDLRFDGIV